ncbi:MAG: acylphosphatase [Candidatus Riflemargulisbacteria bacterium]
MKKAYHLTYSGKVQGVGFRFAVKRIADKYMIVGWVRNLANGKVDVFVQGEESALDSFLKGVDLYFKDNIRDKLITEESSLQFDGFQIRY